MYILFREFHWEPSRYFLMPESEKLVTRVFLRQYQEELEKEQKELERKMKKGGRSR